MAKTAYNALIQYESSVTEYAELMTDSGDHQIFTGSADIWSGNGSYAPDIRPDGVLTGTGILTPHASNDTVAYSAFTAYVSGVLKSVSASSVAITRASTNDYVINSIQYDGSSVSAVKGTEGTSFSTTRGAAGGPPYIAVGSIEIGQIKTDSQTAGVILAAEILQSANAGTQERSDYPAYYTPSNLGLGNEADDADQVNAHVKFVKALATSHTGDVVKGVYSIVNEPDFADIEESVDWVPAEISTSVSSTQLYRITTASSSDSLGSASFTIKWSNPTTNALHKLDGKNITFKFFPDENITDEYELTQGIVRFASTNPVNEDMGATVTIAASTKTVRFG